MLGLARSELTIGVVGRLASLKAPALVVEAVALLDQGPVRVVYVGDGPERRRVLSRAAALDVPVSLVGSRRRAERLLEAFDVVACPSPVESFGLVMAQAAVSKRPLAVVDSPGARYVSGEGALSALCSPTPDGLADALIDSLNSSAEWRERLCARVLERFGPETAGERLRAFYARQVGTVEGLTD
jgi:glycosyltransferase involved in cell wall biosynthesis